VTSGTPRIGGHQEARAHRDALRAEGQRGDQAAAVVEAAGRDHRHLHRVHHLRQQHRGGHAAGVAAALAALDGDDVGAHLDGLLRVLQRAHRGHAHDAGVAQPPITFLSGPRP
jgi:hypothetical protein